MADREVDFLIVGGGLAGASCAAELRKKGESGLYPILQEKTPVRMDLSHSGWSDIFFLGMDFPEGARVLHIGCGTSFQV